MKQLSLVKKSKRQEHGGHVTLGRRRRKRPLDIKQPHHLVLRSDFAYGRRMLTRHRPLINRIIQKAKKRFDIKVYELAIVSNHIHVLAKGRSRSGLQNFFRVVAGHTAQEILRLHPILVNEKPRGGAVPPRGDIKTPASTQAQAPAQAGATAETTTKKPPKTRERENKFWQTRIYSRVVSWGRDFIAVTNYVIQNTLEALGVIPYRPRNSRPSKQNSSNTS